MSDKHRRFAHHMASICVVDNVSGFDFVRESFLWAIVLCLGLSHSRMN